MTDKHEGKYLKTSKFILVGILVLLKHFLYIVIWQKNKKGCYLWRRFIIRGINWYRSRFSERGYFNLDGYTAINNQLSEPSILDAISGIPGTANSLLFGAAGWTVSSAVASIAGIITSSSNSELEGQAQIILDGTNATNNIVEQFVNNDSFSQLEVRVTFLVYEMSDSSRVRFVVYNNYTPIRALTPSGSIELC
ncbi:hypothetical protein [Virgibacillus sp. Bac330]|uniref:hypothetical protein n=1 Tax=Virgibacillus sp. Bac330 TaxID=2419841 RepID=UPI000EF4DBEF|nr:hypothetical protein [Virgibacillus sp. Bac330]